MTLAYSRHQYVEFVFDQRVETWLLCHQHAFVYFGDVPRKVVLDNLKAGIAQACFDEPQVQRASRDCAEHYSFLIAPLLGLLPDQLTSGQMTYHLRRLRLHGLVKRQPNTHRYQVTEFGWRVALFFTRMYARVIRPGLAHIVPDAPPVSNALRRQFDQLETVMDDWIAQANLTT